MIKRQLALVSYRLFSTSPKSLNFLTKLNISLESMKNNNNNKLIKETKASSQELSPSLHIVEHNQEQQHYPVHFSTVNDQIISHYNTYNLHQFEDIYMLDCTIGTGGHSLQLLKNFPNLHILGLDLDNDLIQKLKSYEQIYKERLDLKQGNFADYQNNAYYKDTSRKIYDIIFLDLGWNINQQTGKGLSYSRNPNEELDMRYDASDSKTPKASQLLEKQSSYEQQELLSKYGEIPNAQYISQEFITFRKSNPVLTSLDLKKFFFDISINFGSNQKRYKIMSQFYQALRIAINNEFGNLEKFFENIKDVISINSLFIIIGFHSQECHIIEKNIFGIKKKFKSSFNYLKKGLEPNQEELDNNNPSRSAKLYAFSLNKRGIAVPNNKKYFHLKNN